MGTLVAGAPLSGIRGGIRFDIDSYGPSNNFVT